VDERWEAAVQEAMQSADEPALAVLYKQAVAEVGPAAASHQWLVVVSALDASAHT
jgi:hypothetical protein